MMGPILIQGAMDVETDCLAADLEARETCQTGGWTFWRGHMGTWDVVVSRTGVGTVNCAAATALGIERYAPCVVINQGLGGAHRKDLHVGDLVVGESCISLNSMITPARANGEGSDPFTWTLWDHGEDCELRVWEADPVWRRWLETAPYEGGQKRTGRLGSGDLFSREADRIRWFTGRTEHWCEDMESISAFQVSAQMGVPCIGLRIISNNELTGEAYDRSMGLQLQQFLQNAILWCCS